MFQLQIVQADFLQVGKNQSRSERESDSVRGNILVVIQQVAFHFVQGLFWAITGLNAKIAIVIYGSVH